MNIRGTCEIYYQNSRPRKFSTTYLVAFKSLQKGDNWERGRVLHLRIHNDM